MSKEIKLDPTFVVVDERLLSKEIKLETTFLGGANPLQKPPVFIECGSANSFELSPRFANLAIRGSRVGEKNLILTLNDVFSCLSQRKYFTIILIKSIKSIECLSLQYFFRSMSLLMSRASYERQCQILFRKLQTVSKLFTFVFKSVLDFR